MMNVRAVVCLFGLVLLVYGTGAGVDRATGQDRRRDADEGVQVLTRGPVHEAFAGTVTFDPEPGVVVPQAAPEAIEELPPDQRPEGNNVEWIPGYWAWDDERKGFLWVSGIWRALPQGRQWIPGYWGQIDEGSQWTSGYWADAKLTEIEYLPEPPPSVEVGPNIEATSRDHSWMPGSWVWQQNRYAWRPGYWAEVQPDWIWVPAHYVWTPRGYVFVDGYYDYALNRRGVLFAPVQFDSSYYSRRGFVYSPSIVIDSRLFTEHLFLRPRYGHYYFGDYYSASYHGAGYYPWFSFQSSRRGYDPFFAHHRWHHRHDAAWGHRLETNFGHRRDHHDARPPRTLAAMNQLNLRAEQPGEPTLMFAQPLQQLAQRTDSPFHFQQVDQSERKELGRRGHEVQRFRAQRQKLEAGSALVTVATPTSIANPVRVKLPAAPLVAKRTADAPPRVHVAPKPDLKVQPRPPKARSKAERPQPLPDATGVAPQPVPRPPRTKEGQPKPVPTQETPKAKKFEPRPAPPRETPKVQKFESKPAPPREAPKPKPAPPRETPKVQKFEPKPAPAQAPPKKQPKGESQDPPRKKQ